MELRIYPTALETDRPKLTGKPSIDRPWERYYSKEALNFDIPQMTAYQYLASCSKKDQYLNKPVLIYPDVSPKMIYGEFFEAIDNLAKSFKSMGIEEGEHVSICTLTTFEAMIAFYALNKIGAVINPFDPRNNLEAIKRYLNEGHSKKLIMLDALYSSISKIINDTSVEAIISLSLNDAIPQGHGNMYRAAAAYAKYKMHRDSRCVPFTAVINNGTNYFGPCEAQYSPKKPAVLFHTSGTTGIPKSAMHNNDSLNIKPIQYSYSGMPFTEDDLFLNAMPLFIAYGVSGFHIPLCLHMTEMVIPKLDITKLGRIIMEYKPSHYMGVPEHFASLMKDRYLREATDLSFLVNLGVGGDKMSPALKQETTEFLKERKCNNIIKEGYGITEGGPPLVTNTDQHNKIDSVGIPLPRTNQRIVKINPETGLSTTEELPYNQIGEICISSASNMLGYYGIEHIKDNNKVLRVHPDGQIWVHTGDLGSIDEDGFLHYAGREKNLIIRPDGFKVAPLQIEQAVQSHKAVLSCVAIGVKAVDYNQGEYPLVVITLKDEYASMSDNKIIKEIDAICKEKLPQYFQPCGYRVRKDFPHTPMGKIDIDALKEEYNIPERGKALTRIIKLVKGQ